MDSNTFVTVSNVIKTRRTIKPGQMNGKKIPNGHIAALLELADWAPNHGNTQPWKFVVYEDAQHFAKEHAALYERSSTPETFNPATVNNLTNLGNNVSHVIVAIMQRGDLPKIPPVEEVAAASAAIQNLLLGATALNIASFWSTGGMALRYEMKEFLGLREEDQVLGLLYLGYTDEQLPEGKRKVPVEDKIRWIGNN